MLQVVFSSFVKCGLIVWLALIFWLIICWLHHVFAVWLNGHIIWLWIIDWEEVTLVSYTLFSFVYNNIRS